MRKTSAERARPLQGLIQLSVALHHLRRGNLVGARKMIERALTRLEALPGERAQSNLDRARRYALIFRERLGRQEAEELIADRPRFDD